MYALCVLAPSAAFALSGGDHVAHCLTEDQAIAAHPHQAAKTHTHADGTVHQHHGVETHAAGSVYDHASNHAPKADNDGKNQGTSCCGLFSVIGISWQPNFVLGTFSVAKLNLPALPDTLSGRGPERINRPPIT